MLLRSRAQVNDRIRPVKVTLLALSVLLTLAAPSGAYQRPGTTVRASLAADGDQANGDSGSAAISADGRFVAFISWATNLVSGDTNETTDVFVRDTRTDKVERVSVASDGSQGSGVLPFLNGGVADCAPAGASGTNVDISASGRFVVFESCFDNLVPEGNAGSSGDTNLAFDIFVHDRKTGRTSLASVASDGTQANASSYIPTISDNGRYVGFESGASNLDPRTCADDPVSEVVCESARVLGAGRVQVYVRDRHKQTTRLVSVSGDGAIANGRSHQASISPDGRNVVFTSEADNLTPNDDNRCHLNSVEGGGGIPSCSDVFFHELSSGKTELISVGLDGYSADWASGVAYAPKAISADNRYVLFSSYANNVVPNPSAPSGVYPMLSYGVYVRDRKTGRTEKISVDHAGRPALRSRYYAGNLSANGRYAIFYDEDTEVGRSDCRAITGFRMHDRTTGGTENYPKLIEASTCESTTTVPGRPSRDGRYIAFESFRSDIVEHDTNKGGKGAGQGMGSDIFLIDRGPGLGIGGFGSSPSPGKDPSDERICVGDVCIPPGAAVSSSDLVNDVDGSLTEQGANLYGASIAYRPRYEDLFVAIELEHMPQVLPGPFPVLYGLRFDVAARNYEVRATSLLGGTFGLFDCTDRAICTKVTDLSGGYGTTGMRVVFSLPLADVGLEAGSEFRNVEAFSALGSFHTGASDTLDTVRLPDRMNKPR